MGTQKNCLNEMVLLSTKLMDKTIFIILCLNGPMIFFYYCRSLFFRILDFLKLGIKLVFVIDGRAPDVKHKVMVQRQQQQFGSMATTLVSPDRPSMLGDVKRVHIFVISCIVLSS